MQVTLKERVEYLAAMAVLALLLVLPHKWRVPIAGRLATTVLGPVLGWRRKIGANLDLVMPDLTPVRRRRLIRGVSDNLGRLFIEVFSPEDMRQIAAVTPLQGPGVAAMETARAEGRPILCVSGHIGNHDVGRSVLIQHGFDVGGLYRPMNNRLFNVRYERSIGAVGGKIFPRGRSGLGEMIRHLRGGGLLALMIDQHMGRGARLTFFGTPAYTATSAAQMALKYDALLVPIYAIRQPDGLNFAVHAELPVPHTDDETMTQALNDSLEAQVRAHPEQWLWTHRRWKTRP